MDLDGLFFPQSGDFLIKCNIPCLHLLPSVCPRRLSASDVVVLVVLVVLVVVLAFPFWKCNIPFKVYVVCDVSPCLCLTPRVTNKPVVLQSSSADFIGAVEDGRPRKVHFVVPPCCRWCRDECQLSPQSVMIKDNQQSTMIPYTNKAKSCTKAHYFIRFIQKAFSSKIAFVKFRNCKGMTAPNAKSFTMERRTFNSAWINISEPI